MSEEGMSRLSAFLSLRPKNRLPRSFGSIIFVFLVFFSFFCMLIGDAYIIIYSELEQKDIER